MHSRILSDFACLSNVFLSEVNLIVLWVEKEKEFNRKIYCFYIVRMKPLSVILNVDEENNSLSLILLIFDLKNIL